MTTVDERIDELVDDGNTFIGLEIDDGTYYISYTDGNGTLHKLKCIVDGEDIVSESEVSA